MDGSNYTLMDSSLTYSANICRIFNPYIISSGDLQILSDFISTRIPVIMCAISYCLIIILEILGNFKWPTKLSDWYGRYYKRENLLLSEGTKGDSMGDRTWLRFFWSWYHWATLTPRKMVRQMVGYCAKCRHFNYKRTVNLVVNS